MQGVLATKLGDPTGVYWFIPSYTSCIAVGFLMAGANSDLFGRRLCLLTGEVGVTLGMIILATAHSTKQFQAGLGICGFFSGFSQMSLCSIT
jgi:MFS family permease